MPAFKNQMFKYVSTKEQVSDQDMHIACTWTCSSYRPLSLSSSKHPKYTEA